MTAERRQAVTVRGVVAGTRPAALARTSAPGRPAAPPQPVLDVRSLIGLQRRVGNHAATLAVQRQPGVRDTRHPENFPTYEGWLGTFAALPTFESHDQAPHGSGASFRVLGDKAASHDPSSPPDERAPDPIGPRPGDAFIDHPTDKWVRDNLPEELRQTAYRLPADCADIAVILRHVWLFAHRRSEQYGPFVVGFVAGETAGARSKRVGRAIAGIDTPQMPTMINPYADSSGRPLRSVVALAPLLYPGDILLWAHHAGESTPDPTRPRTGGHTQTIVSIERRGSTIRKIVTLQGNQPLPKSAGEGLRHTPGRRIEVRDLDDPKDLTIPARGRTPAEQVWDFGDGHTTLVVAGPPKSGERPAAKREGGRIVRHLTDWRPAIAAAPRAKLIGLFEAAMREAQALLEQGTPPARVEGEARSLGVATRTRLDALDAQLARSRKPADPAARNAIRETLAAMRTGQGSTRPAEVTRVATAVTGAFEGTVRQAGWSGVAAGDPNAGERMVGSVRRIPVEGLPGQADRAIVAVPATITGGPAAVDVLLHFHGRTQGWKKAADTGADRIEAQLEASGRRMLAVLPQGSAKADFGEFDANSYLTAVFATLVAMRVFDPAPPRGSVVVSGHSGGGKVAADLVTGGALAGVGELALFDGINGPVELAAVESWAIRSLDAAAARLRAPTVRGDATREDGVLATVVALRAYHTGSASARPSHNVSDYPGLHATLRATITDWFDRNAVNLSPRAAAKLRAKFEIIATGHRNHLGVVGGASRPRSPNGALADALAARP